MSSGSARGETSHGGVGERILDLLAALNTHSRYSGSGRDAAYTQSYRVMRLVVGVLGVALPVIFIIGEFFLRGSVHVRGSISAYYHTSMQDVFVGGLCVIGFLLATYMAGEFRTWDFRASLIAGLAVLGVVFFPTSRSGLPPGAPACGSVPEPPGCSAVEQALGEHQTALIHGACAIVFILFLAVMSFLFAASEVRSKQDRLTARSRGKSRVFWKPRLFWIHSSGALVILAAGAWAFAGAGIRELTPLYIGEVVSVMAFGVSWIIAGISKTAPTRVRPALVTPHGPALSAGAAPPVSPGAPLNDADLAAQALESSLAPAQPASVASAGNGAVSDDVGGK
jgi:hypothetical protein